MSEKKVVGIIGTLDTKGKECEFVRDIIKKQGLETLIIDSGVKNKPKIKADVSREEVAAEGGESLKSLIEKDDRGHAVSVMGRGVNETVSKLFKENKIDGLISLGGSAGTTIGTAAMRSLPYGVPKVMVSTLASGDTSPFVGTKDILMLNSVVDVAGLNKILKTVLTNAALSVASMVKNNELVKNIKSDKPLIAASMFGVTTPCIEKAKEYLEDKGYEVLVFHATGTGGRTMEELVREGHLVGVLDVTTTELADELVGGVLTAGKNRLEAAAEKGIPQVISTGALDMVNFGPFDTVPDKFSNRNLYKHNENVTLMRTNKEENRQLGKILAEKINKSEPGKTEVFLPLGGVSMIDAEGQPFYGPDEDELLFNEIEKNLKNGIKLHKLANNINDDEFAVKMAESLHKLIQNN